MNEPMVVCPNCKGEVKLTESLAAPLVEAARQEYEARLAAIDSDIKVREKAIHEKQIALTKARESIELQVEERVTQERDAIAAEEARKARTFFSADMEQKARAVADLEAALKTKEDKLAEAQRAQADLIRKSRELDDARREMDLTIEKRVQESVSAVREKALQEAEDGLQLKVFEKEEIIKGLQRHIETLKRKAEQGSQQIQGEVQELDLERLLKGKFPHDLVEPVPVGQCGGDIIQRVFSPFGVPCGLFLWETKRTKNWNDSWLAKLRDDQRAIKADFALIVSSAVPKAVQGFDQIEGVWVIEPRYAVPVATALRLGMIELGNMRQAREGQDTKMGMVYEYLTGPRFRQRVEAIVESFSEMQADLDKERRAMMKNWAKREGQIRGVIESTAGMYGDLQGIAGSAFAEIESLEMLGLPAADES